MRDPVIDRLVSAMSGEYQYYWHLSIRDGERLPARCSVCGCELIINPMTVYQQTIMRVGYAYTCSSHYCRNKLANSRPMCAVCHTNPARYAGWCLECTNNSGAGSWEMR